MKITKRQLKRIIREEKAKLIKESNREAAINFHRGEMDFGEDKLSDSVKDRQSTKGGLCRRGASQSSLVSVV